MDATHLYERIIRTASKNSDRSWYQVVIKVKGTYDSMIYNITPELQQSAGILVTKKLSQIAENNSSALPYPIYPKCLLSSARMPSGGKYETVPHTLKVS